MGKTWITEAMECIQVWIFDSAGDSSTNEFESVFEVRIINPTLSWLSSERKVFPT